MSNIAFGQIDYHPASMLSLLGENPMPEYTQQPGIISFWRGVPVSADKR